MPRDNCIFKYFVRGDVHKLRVSQVKFARVQRHRYQSKRVNLRTPTLLHSLRNSRARLKQILFLSHKILRASGSNNDISLPYAVST